MLKVYQKSSEVNEHLAISQSLSKEAQHEVEEPHGRKLSDFTVILLKFSSTLTMDL
jgi:hypothetical protein